MTGDSAHTQLYCTKTIISCVTLKKTTPLTSSNEQSCSLCAGRKQKKKEFLYDILWPRRRTCCYSWSCPYARHYNQNSCQHEAELLFGWKMTTKASYHQGLCWCCFHLSVDIIRLIHVSPVFSPPPFGGRQPALCSAATLGQILQVDKDVCCAPLGQRGQILYQGISCTTGDSEG